MGIKLNIDGVNSDKIGSRHGLNGKELSSVDKKLSEIQLELTEKLSNSTGVDAMMAWLNLGSPSEDHLKRLKTFSDEISNKYKILVVIGIGGSSLGAKALLHALYYLGPDKNRPEIVFLENADPETLARFENRLPKDSLGRPDYRQVAINVISKSGTTAETSANFELVLEHMKACGIKDFSASVIATTDPQKGRLHEIALEMKLRTLEVPNGVGGRFSVFSDVGLFPLVVAGVDIDALLKGVRKGLEQAQRGVHENHAFLIAKIFYLLDTLKGKNLHGLFLYGDAFLEIGAWFEQLWAESLGKSDTVGPRPLSMIGSTAQHSVNQDNIAGIPNKAILFVGVEKSRVDYSMQGESVDYLSGNRMHQLLMASMRGTEEALIKRGRPYIEIMLGQINEETLGEFLFTLEVATFVAGRLYGVDPFNQPAVEEAKISAKELLRKNQQNTAS